MTESAAGTRPLDSLQHGQSGMIVSLDTGHGFVRRLAALGFVPGTRVTMVQNNGHGPLIVMARQCRVALGRGQARHILVHPEEGP